MTYRFRAAFYVFMMLLVSAVIFGLYLDRPRDNPVGDTPAAVSDNNTVVPTETDGPVTDAKVEAANQA
jgi:hypothetical protein